MQGVRVRYHDGPRDGQHETFKETPYPYILIPGIQEQRGMMGQPSKRITWNWVYELGEVYEGISHYFCLGIYHRREELNY